MILLDCVRPHQDFHIVLHIASLLSGLVSNWYDLYIYNSVNSSFSRLLLNQRSELSPSTLYEVFVAKPISLMLVKSTWQSTYMVSTGLLIYTTYVKEVILC